MLLAAYDDQMRPAEAANLLVGVHSEADGPVEVALDSMHLLVDTGLTLTAYSAEPDSPSHDALKLLASWAATTETAEQPRTGEGAR